MGIGVKGFGGSGSGNNTKLQGFAALPPAAVAAKKIFQVAPPVGGELWAWGKNSQKSQLGDGTLTNRNSPIQIGSLTDWASVSGSLYHSHAVKTDGTLWGWGKNDKGQVGTGIPSRFAVINSPVQVGNLTDWASVHNPRGDSWGVALKTDGTLWTWGINSWGQLGNGTNTTTSSSPGQVGSLTDWASVSAGRNWVIATKTDNTLWGWGRNGSGEIGDGTSVHRSSPVQIGALTDWASAHTGYFSSFGIKTDNTLWTWGTSPTQIGTLTDWASVDGGKSWAAAVKTDGTLWTWGTNSPSGQLGQGTPPSSGTVSPVQVGALTDWASVLTGHFHVIARKTDGTLWAWGESKYGTLGNSLTTPDKSSPIQIGALTTWITSSAGAFHSFGIKPTE